MPNVDADQAKHEAIDRAEKGAGSDWMARALAVLGNLRRHGGDSFTSDDVREWMRRRNMEPAEPRAYGALMRAACRNGLVLPTGAWEASADTRCHGRPKRVWTWR